MKQVNKLPYCTSEGHEFDILTEGDKAVIKCFTEVEDERFNSINPRGLTEMIKTASFVGIKKIELHTNYGVNIHSHSLKTNPTYKNFSIIK